MKIIDQIFYIFYILNLQNSICILYSQQFRLATFQVFNNQMWQLTTLDRAVLRNTTGFPEWLCQFIFLRVVYEHYSCSTSSSGLGAYPYFNAAAVLYLFPTTNRNFIIIVILDTMSLLQQSGPNCHHNYTTYVTLASYTVPSSLSGHDNNIYKVSIYVEQVTHYIQPVPEKMNYSVNYYFFQWGFC